MNRECPQTEVCVHSLKYVRNTPTIKNQSTFVGWFIYGLIYLYVAWVGI